MNRALPFALLHTSAPLFADHLWQSTIFVLAAAVLALFLRRDQARIRYAVWLTASLKFIFPFALLVHLGSMVAPHRSTTPASAVFYATITATITQWSVPFTHSTLALAAGPPRALRLLPAIFFAVWAAGALFVLARWRHRWASVAAAARKATPTLECRELESLRRLQSAASVRKDIPFLITDDALEPGIFGIFQPVLLWPTNFSRHLDEQQLDAILAHEVCHVRRRDNLAAAAHMLVEALFWFHPLVWWIGARLLDERERACDEEVLRLCATPQVYAESILKASRFCVESPLACVSGVTGSNLERRVVRIMTQPAAGTLSRGTKLILAAVAIASLAIPVSFGLFHPYTLNAQAPSSTSPAIQSMSVDVHPGDSKSIMLYALPEPGELSLKNTTVAGLIGYAYGVRDFQIIGGPDWIRTEVYDIEAKVPAAEAKQLTPLQQQQQRQLMAQSILANRFHLTLTRQTANLPIYNLRVGEGGPKFSISTPRVAPNGEHIVSMKVLNDDHGKKGFISMDGAPVGALADQLSERLGREVVDQTGLTGEYSFSLSWIEDGDQIESILANLQQQLGLKLEEQQGPVKTITVDEIERPASS